MMSYHYLKTNRSDMTEFLGNSLLSANKKFMIENLKALFSSSRFQGLLLIAGLQALVLFNVITSAQGEGLIHIIQGLIVAAATIKTVDRVGDKKVEAANIASRVAGRSNMALRSSI